MRYEKAGVSLQRADETVRRLRSHVESTFNDSVVSGFGHFAGVVTFGEGGEASPMLAASVDGVGTKVLLAAEAGAHATVAGDVVRHGANDCLAVGARPLFFLDYIGWGRVEPDAMEEVARGLAAACRAEGCVLLGGETAEMPDIYHGEHFDLVGCMVGTIAPGERVDGSAIRAGDQIWALPSVGLHTNGYTLARRLVRDAGLGLTDAMPGTALTVAEALLAPHRSYTRAILPLVESRALSGLAHVTGGGIAGNLVRVLPEMAEARLEQGSWEIPAVFRALQELGHVPDEDMMSTFNQGVGYLLVMPRERNDEAVAALSAAGESPWRLGEIVEGARRVTWID
jgi:phosphoribosylformylglycinamidine cyclo-ligase